jgi:uncharacterized protein
VLNILLIGTVGGVLSGMLGVGGAVIMLPLLTIFGGLTLKEASNITIVQVVAAAMISIAVYNRARLVHMRLALHMGGAAVLGGIGGGYGSQAMPSWLLEWLFLVVVVVAIALLFIPVRDVTPPLAATPGAAGAPGAPGAAGTTAESRMPPFNRNQAVGLGVSVGALAGVLGAGGGFLIVPLMIGALRLPTRLAIGSSPVVILISSMAGLSGKLIAGQVPFLPAAALVVGAVPATYLGTRIGRRLSPRSLRYLLMGLLIVIAIRGVLVILRVA